MLLERDCLKKLIDSYQPGTLNIITGRPGMGKTTLAANMVLIAREPIAIFNLGGFLQHSVRYIPAKWIHIDETEKLTVEDIWGKVLQIKEKTSVRWVIIDWLELIKTDEEGKDKIAEWLKKMAVELQVAVIATSFASRSAELRSDRKPILQDTRGWELIEPWVDDVRILYRPEYYRIEKDEHGSTHDVCYLLSTERHQGDLGDLRLSWKSLFKTFEMAKVKRTTDTDILRQELADTEYSIFRMVKPFDEQIERNSYTEQHVLKHLEERVKILNRMFELHCTEAEVRRFESVNDALRKMANRFYAEHRSLRQQLDKVPDMGDPSVCRLALFSQLNYCHDHENPQLFQMEEDRFYGSHWNEMLWVIDSISKTNALVWIDDTEDNLDDGLTWAEGPLCIPPLEHVCVCRLAHALCTRLPFSIPDLLRMTTYTCERSMWEVSEAKME